MNSEQVSDLIKFFLTIAGAVTVIWQVLDYLNKRDKEKSVGTTKVLELINADKKIREDIEQLQKSDSTKSGELEILKSDYKRLMDRIWDFMRRK